MKQIRLEPSCIRVDGDRCHYNVPFPEATHIRTTHAYARKHREEIIWVQAHCNICMRTDGDNWLDDSFPQFCEEDDPFEECEELVDRRDGMDFCSHRAVPYRRVKQSGTCQFG